jgi:hypothetical protein
VEVIRSREGLMSFFGQLEGARIRANDGKFLGAITEQSIHPDAITNPVGVHGNQISETSIFNRDGLYGNRISPQSAFNEMASDPPRVIQNGSFVGYLSVNPARSPRIDPRQFFSDHQSGNRAW